MRLSTKSLIVGVLFALGSFGMLTVLSSSARAGDCDDNAVIRCGFTSIDGANAAMTKYPKLFAAYGVSKGLAVKEGQVHGNGNVTVDGKVVATGAHSVGRQYMPGSTKISYDGETFYDRPTSTSFANPGGALDAFVYFKSDGTFSGAIIKACGNPVLATNKVVIVKNVTVCNLTTRKMETISEATYNANKSKYSTNADDCQPITVCDLTTYKTITINRDQFDGTKHSRDLEECQPVRVCDLKSGSVITVSRKESQDESKHTTDLTKCEKMTVCDLKTHATTTISRSEYDSSKYTTDMSQCEKIKVCVLESKTIKEIYKNEFNSTLHSTQLSDCEQPVAPVTPTTPTTPVLPQTGTADILGGSLGIGSLVAAAYYYFSSRKLLGIQ